jgi:hypothetical protein
MTDPRTLTTDQRDLLDALEAVALLPQPIQEDDFLPVCDRAVGLLEARGFALRGQEKPQLATLLLYELHLRRDGHHVAGDGLQLLVERFELEYVDLTSRGAKLN